MAWLEPGHEGNKTVRQLFEEESVFRHHSGIDNHFVAAGSFVCKREEQVLGIWRSSVVQWYYDVVDHLNAPRETVYVAMNFLDRAVDRRHHEQQQQDNRRPLKELTKEGYELLSTTCLFLAIRVSSSFQLKMDELLRMIDSKFQPKDLQHQGAWLLESHSFKQVVVSPVAFAKAYLRTLVNEAPTSPVDVPQALALLETVTYLLELSVCDPSLARVPASELAYAAVASCLRHRHPDLSETVLQQSLIQLNREAQDYVTASTMCDRLTLIERMTSMIQLHYQRNDPHLNRQHPPHEVNDHLDTCAELHIIDNDDDEDDKISTSPSSRMLSTSLPSRLPWSPTMPTLETIAKLQYPHHFKRFPSSCPK